MRDAVFGIPVTNITLESLPEYEGNTDLKPIDRARVALKLKNSDGKNELALKYLLDLKASSGYDVGTLCLVYNATGDTLKYALKKDWAGHIGSSPYPIQIANGQWGAFLHVQGKASTQSIGAVVYLARTLTRLIVTGRWLGTTLGRQIRIFPPVYSEVLEKDHFNWTGTDYTKWWDFILEKLQKSDVYYEALNIDEQWKGTSSSASIGNHSFPIFTAILTLNDV